MPLDPNLPPGIYDIPDEERTPPDEPLLTDEQITIEKEVDKVRERVRKELYKLEGNRPPYVIPQNRFSEAQLMAKLTKYGQGLGISIPRDILYGMGLKKGKIVKLTISLTVDDTILLRAANTKNDYL